MKKNYRILQIVDSLDIGGTERMSVNICNALTSNNIDNYLVVSRRSGPIYNFIKVKNNVSILNKKHLFDVIAFYKLLKIVLSFKPSIIHAHQTSIYWTFAIKLFFPNIMLVWHDHWGFSDLLKDSDRKLIKYFSFLIDGVICVNDKIKEWNIKNLKINNENIIFIPNFPVIKIKEKTTNLIPIVLCLANIRDQKDHPNLIQACCLLKEQNINFKLYLAGSLEDDVEVNKVKKMIKDLNLDDIVFLLGPVKDVSEILSQTDIGVLSSISEGLPVSLLEYGLAELPVVCTDVGQCKEVLGNGKYGWIVPSNSPKAFAEALKQALLNMPQARLKGIALKNHINECYGANGFLAKYFELINRIKIEKIILKTQNK